MLRLGFYHIFTFISIWQCKIEWYHIGCVGVKELPKGKWYCPSCVGFQKKRKSK